MYVDPYLQKDEGLTFYSGTHETFIHKLDLLTDKSIASLQTEKLKIIEAGESFIDLSMINPDIPPSRYLLDRLFEATHQPVNHRYAVARGIRKLRKAVSQKYAHAFGATLHPETDICMTMGAKDATLHLLQVLWEKDAKILIPDPCYPAHRAAALLNDYKIETYELSRNEEELFQRIGAKLSGGNYRVLLCNFPHNPTGISVSKEFYRKLNEALKDTDTYLVNDFVYGDMPLYGSDPVSVFSPDNMDFNRVLEIYSMSKAYGVPGWRVGAVSGDAQVVKILSQLKAYVDYGIFLPLQYAAAAALSSDKDIISETLSIYRSRADVLINGLRSLDWDVTHPDGGISIWARIPDSVRVTDSVQFCKKLLQNHRVLLMPGKLFGKRYGRFIRFALVRSEEELSNVIDQISEFNLSDNEV